MVVALVQAVVRKASEVPASTTVGVLAYVPKFNPEMVTEAPPLLGAFLVRENDRSGASNVMTFVRVPTSVETMSITEAVPAAAGLLQVTVVPVVHAVVLHRPSSTIAVGV
jgi:hypothetical protein